MIAYQIIPDIGWAIRRVNVSSFEEGTVDSTGDPVYPWTHFSTMAEAVVSLMAILRCSIKSNEFEEYRMKTKIIETQTELDRERTALSRIVTLLAEIRGAE